MPIKIKGNIKKFAALNLAENAKKHYLRIVDKFIKEEVVSVIESGRSPAEKGGMDPANTGGSLRYEKYSESYKGAFGKGDLKQKKQRPINLTVTGKMLNSIKSRRTAQYVRVWFTDSKAKYHDKLGAGKSKVIRRLVPNPKRGEDFNPGIKRRLVNALKQAIKLSKK